MNPPASSHCPPRLAERLVRLVAGDDAWCEVTTGDLREEYAVLSETRGRLIARLWYYGQAIQLFAAFAARAARRALSSIISVARPQGDHVIRTVAQEIRYACRSLLHQPLVTGIVLLTLALGLGANAATFGMIDALLLRPFPIDAVDELVLISENSAAEPYPQETVSTANFTDFRRETTSLEHLSAFRWWDVNLAGTREPERLEGFAVTSDFFQALRTAPAIGRFLDEQDMTFGRHRQVVLGDGLWKRRFGSNPAVIGQSVNLDGEPYSVIGVAPRGFDFPNGASFWVPYAPDPKTALERDDHVLTVLGRLREGRTRDAAAIELETIYTRIKAEHVDATRGRQIVIRTFTEGMVDIGMPQILLLWQTAAALVLLIGCTNITNLLLARGAARQRELAVRLAIGAGRWRVIRHLLVESVVLAVAATPLAIGVASLTLRLCQRAMPAELVRYVAGWQQMGVTTSVMLFTLGAAVLTALVFGLLPALQVSRPALTSTLRDGGRSMSGSAARSRLRRGLVVAEIAVALPLLIASGLSAIGAHRFATGPQGYDPDGLFRARTMLSGRSYEDADAKRRFVERLVEQARKQPGVQMAATSSVLPSMTSNQVRRLEIDGRVPDPQNSLTINFRATSPEYLSVLRIPILRGRGLSEADRAETEPVAVISQAAANLHWPDGSALGKRIRVGGADRPWTTVVGISGDTIDDWFAQRRVPTVYVPFAQMPTSSVGLILRTNGDPAALATAARAAVAAVDPQQPVFDALTMRDALRIRTTGLRFVGALMAAFGALALVLSAVGIYSVMAFYVAQRRHEMGIRMALGATGRDVLRLTVGHGARMASLGIAIGLLFGIALARLLESALFGVVALEPWLFAAVAITLALVAFLASIVPARFAAAADPVQALRAE
jgi:putative ABC transport system permease protein